eukprot:CAMPEP_0201545674 /NCGR_PEP_ID=MMETSP0173_2-20130828/2114_1 /ASSEMBLY_ACC=CAM_ASM_000268 /TAXON_ID=218659 /ORGANISM="Vexillifera sp., Strain DIVA3 564/2" /LENGTH=277 /DNA_ID=CAMNT_0047954139 /DNA_START=55 /DNA_END=888 /DNA_ORIENTATION=+
MEEDKKRHRISKTAPQSIVGRQRNDASSPLVSPATLELHQILRGGGGGEGGGSGYTLHRTTPPPSQLSPSPPSHAGTDIGLLHMNALSPLRKAPRRDGDAPTRRRDDRHTSGSQRHMALKTSDDEQDFGSFYFLQSSAGSPPSSSSFSFVDDYGAEAALAAEKLSHSPTSLSSSPFHSFLLHASPASAPHRARSPPPSEKTTLASPPPTRSSNPLFHNTPFLGDHFSIPEGAEIGLFSFSPSPPPPQQRQILYPTNLVHTPVEQQHQTRVRRSFSIG